MVDVGGITCSNRRLPRCRKNLIHHFYQTRIASIACMKLNQTRSPLLIQQESTHVVRNCLGGRECVKNWLCAGAKIFSRSRKAQRAPRGQSPHTCPPNHKPPPFPHKHS